MEAPQPQQVPPAPGQFHGQPIPGQFGPLQGRQFQQIPLDDRSTSNKAASNITKTVGKVTDRTKVIYVKATGDGVQKVRAAAGFLGISLISSFGSVAAADGTGVTCWNAAGLPRGHSIRPSVARHNQHVPVSRAYTHTTTAFSDLVGINSRCSSACCWPGRAQRSVRTPARALVTGPCGACAAHRMPPD